MTNVNEPPGQASAPVIRAMMMPRDTNYHGTIFGGIILSLIDQAAGVAAAMRAGAGVVTLKMDEVIFRNPVFVGDLVSVYANVVKVGRTSLTIQSEVYAQRRDTDTPVHVTSASLIFVAVGPDRRPVPIANP
jgi:acyl-CoA thioesterase YciA